MKKHFVLIGIVVLLIMSCSTSVGLVFDESVPGEQSAQIITAGTGKVTEYNGIPVNWDFFGPRTIQIPAGDTILVWDIDSTSGYIGKNMAFRYYFKAQMKYMFVASQEDGIAGLNVWEHGLDDKVGVAKDTDPSYQGFFPFLNARAPGEKKVLQ